MRNFFAAVWNQVLKPKTAPPVNIQAALSGLGDTALISMGSGGTDVNDIAVALPG